MNKLYTPLVKAKMELAAGRGVPMTPIPKAIQVVIDSNAGLGAINETEERGLECPVRGCRFWGHVLTRHANVAHADIGGAAGIKRLLEIPQHVRLISSSSRARFVENGRRQWQASSTETRARIVSAGAANLSRGRRERHEPSEVTKPSRLMGWRNFRNWCEAQFRNDMILLQQELGRVPTRREAERLRGHGYVHKLRDLYGSWNAACAYLGLEFNIARHRRRPMARRLTRDAVLASLAAYYEMHGHLPTYRHAIRPSHGPLIPSRSSICKAMGAHGWDEAMRRAAALLGITGGQWGLPSHLQRPA